MIEWRWIQCFAVGGIRLVEMTTTWPGPFNRWPDPLGDTDTTKHNAYTRESGDSVKYNKPGVSDNVGIVVSVTACSSR